MHREIEMSADFRIPEPIYYKGRVIQPHWKGFFVDDRAEYSVPTKFRFDTIIEACAYIDKGA